MRLFTGILLFLSINVYAQKIKKSDWKIIPANLEESLTRLDVLSDDQFKKDFTALPETVAIRRINLMGPGSTVRENWKLWRGSVLSRYFNSIGIADPELMTRMIFTSYHRKLGNRDIDQKGQLELYTDMQANPIKYEKIPLDRVVVGDTVISEFSVKSPTRTQDRCDLTAVVTEINKELHQFKIALIKVVPNPTTMKYDKEKYREGLEYWETVTGLAWRKKGEFIEIHIGP